MRNTLETAPKPPVMSATRRLLALNAALASPQMAANAAGHAHRLEHLGVAAARLGEHVPLRAMGGGSLDRPAGQCLGEDRHGDQEQAADGGGDPDQRVEGEADGEVERHPRQIEQRPGAGPRQEAADLIEIA